MDYAGLFVGGLMLLAIISYGLLSWIMKSARKFPWCLTCGKNMTTTSLPMFMPGEVVKHLGKYSLPMAAASRYICPKGHYQLWFVPRFGNTEKAFFLREEL